MVRGMCSSFWKVLESKFYILICLAALKFTFHVWDHGGLIAGRICNNFLVDCALFDKSMKLGTGVDL